MDLKNKALSLWHISLCAHLNLSSVYYLSFDRNIIFLPKLWTLPPSAMSAHIGVEWTFPPPPPVPSAGCWPGGVGPLAAAISAVLWVAWTPPPPPPLPCAGDAWSGCAVRPTATERRDPWRVQPPMRYTWGDGTLQQEMAGDGRRGRRRRRRHGCHGLDRASEASFTRQLAWVIIISWCISVTEYWLQWLIDEADKHYSIARAWLANWFVYALLVVI